MSGILDTTTLKDSGAHARVSGGQGEVHVLDSFQPLTDLT